MSTSTFRMSQDLAGKIAFALLEPKFKEAEVMQKELAEYLTVIAESTVPAPVMELFKKYSDYIETSQNVYLNEKGFNRESITLSRRVPNTGGNYVEMSITDTQASKAKKLHNIYKNKVENNKRLRQEIKTALLNLKTFAQIQKSFPEAVQYLPKSESVALVVDLSKLRKEIK